MAVKKNKINVYIKLMISEKNLRINIELLRVERMKLHCILAVGLHYPKVYL